MLADRRVVITGASRGLGLAVAACCARHGAVVGLGYNQNEQAARDAAAAIVDSGGVAMALALDVCDPDSVQSALAAFTAAHGHIDGLVNNAGVNNPGLLVSTDLDAYRQMLDVNLMGPIVCTRAAIGHMLRRRQGVIVFISSVAAERPFRGQAVYAATKGGVEAFTRAVAVEYAKKGIRAVCLRAGAIDTDMLAAARVLGEDELLARTLLKRIAAADEMAEHVAFLLSDRACYMTGSCVTVDGGYLQA